MSWKKKLTTGAVLASLTAGTIYTINKLFLLHLHLITYFVKRTVTISIGDLEKYFIENKEKENLSF